MLDFVWGAHGANSHGIQVLLKVAAELAARRHMILTRQLNIQVGGERDAEIIGVILPLDIHAFNRRVNTPISLEQSKLASNPVYQTPLIKIGKSLASGGAAGGIFELNSYGDGSTSFVIPASGMIFQVKDLSSW